VNERPRRRRYEDDADRTRGGLPLFPLVVIVIFAGLLLGGVLAHFFGGASAPHASPGPLAVVTPQPSATASASPARSPKSSTATPSVQPSAAHRTPSPLPSRAPSTRPSATATPVKSTPAPAAAATPTAAPTPKLKPAVTMTPARRAVAAPPSPATVAPEVDRASSVVRSYLGALARGDRATATSYLTRGLPGEVFMDSSARILSVRSSGSGDRQHVVADVQTSSGEYEVNFTVVPGIGGLQIDDHYAIKVR
jgi:hypothetical protein